MYMSHKPVELKKLSRQQFNTLKENNLLFEIYPNAPEDYEDLSIDKPKIIASLTDFSNILDMCQKYIDDIWDNPDYFDEDNDSAIYFFEETLKTAFGQDVYRKINKKLDEKRS